MEAQAIAQAQADLVAWGILEAGEPRLTRRAQAAIARAAATLREKEVSGIPVAGHPLVLAAALALADLAPAGKATPAHESVLAAAELASLPEGVRGMFSASRP